MFIGRADSQRGVSLVELIVFIVIVSVAVAGVLTAFTSATRSSADPMIQKQALAIAEAFLEEVELQPFTYCDPDDANAATALSTVGCTTVETMGPELAQGENRYSATTPFDNVNDYNGYDSSTDAPPGIKDIAQTAISGLGAYQVVVGVAGQPLNGVGNDANGNPQSLLITVTVRGPGNTTVVLDGYRVRYTPNSLP